MKYSLAFLAILIAACFIQAKAPRPIKYEFSVVEINQKQARLALTNVPVGFEEIPGFSKGERLFPNFQNSDQTGHVWVQSGRYQSFVSRKSVCAKIENASYCVKLVDGDRTSGWQSMSVGDENTATPDGAKFDCLANVEINKHLGNAKIECHDLAQNPPTRI